jgi:phosphoribosylformylglycinamidine cyclo-ligase
MTTYKETGVDIDAGEETVRRIKPAVHETHTEGVLTGIGAFGGLFELDAVAYDDPVLVSSIDGVGTKLLAARRAGRYDTIGRDLVNHCVNDIAVSGAQPLFFLDYYATGSLSPDVGEDVIGGFAHACKENSCALIGGEIAEMPDVYDEENFDIAGAVVGVVDKSAIVDGSRIEAGDVLVGLPSTGLHTNGYTLARAVLFEHFDVGDAPAELGGATVGEALLRVHRSYLEPIQALIENDLARGFVHVTGGGVAGNAARVVPSGLTAEADYDAWARPAIFDMIQRLGDVPEDDMRRTFNLGVGLIAISAPANIEETMQVLREAGEEPFRIGRIVDES